MTSRMETSSVKALATAVAISALSLTTTVNTTDVFYAPPKSMMSDMLSSDNIGTTTLTSKLYDVKKTTTYEQAKELFVGEMRDFTKDEAEKYQKSLEKIYKSTGVNIFDLC